MLIWVFMLSLINASHFQCRKINEALTVFGSKVQTPTAYPQDFTAALKPTTWQANFEPFAHVIVDHHTQEIVLVRDHLGVQPLYYWYQSGQCIFGDTIPDILQQLPSTPALNEEELTALFLECSLYSDQTFYQGIYRVEPGHIIYIKPTGQVQKKAFWQLMPEGETLYYQHEAEYLEHFSELMREAVSLATRGQTKVALEYSGGMDCSAIYCTAAEQGLRPDLIMHAPIAGSQAASYNDTVEKAFLAHYHIQNVQRITAESFDPLAVFQKYAHWFAGPAPHIFYTFANNIHQAVAKGGYPILLSGFGGDQGVSAHMPPRFVLPELLKQKEYRQAWDYLGSPISPFQQPLQSIRRLQALAQYTHPLAYTLQLKLRNTACRLRNVFKGAETQLSLQTEPYFTQYYPSHRAALWSLLQGPLSHEVRMRIEYSSIVSKKLGFAYRYPLLYPKLLEFFLSLPLEQKRHQGISRYLMRRYMAQYLPAHIFDQYQKQAGLHILPATWEKYQSNVKSGRYQTTFRDFPYQHLYAHFPAERRMKKDVHAYMLKAYFSRTA